MFNEADLLRLLQQTYITKMNYDSHSLFAVDVHAQNTPNFTED